NRKLPGVGASIGLDRILAALEELGKLGNQSSPSKVFVTLLDESVKGKAFELVAALRAENIPAEAALEVSQLGGQLKYADRKGIPLAVILGERELALGACAVKELSSKTQHDGVSFKDLPSKVRSLFEAPR